MPFPGLLAIQHGIPTGDLQVWWDFSRLVGLSDSDPITAAPDLSGHGNTATTVSTQEPLYRTNIINGRAVAQFVGSSSMYFACGFDPSAWSAATAYVVAKNNNDPAVPPYNGFWIWNPGGFNLTHHPFDDGVIYDTGFTTVRKTVGDPTPSLASPHYYGVFSTSGDWRARLNGTQIFSSGTNSYEGGTTSDFRRLGVSHSPGQGFHYYDGYIGELLIWNVILASDDLAIVEDYLANKWGI